MDDVSAIVTKAERAINAVLNNHIKPETCPEKRQKAAWKREKVVKELVSRLAQPGPSMIK